MRISPEEIAIMACLIYPTIPHTANRAKLAVKAARDIVDEVETQAKQQEWERDREMGRSPLPQQQS